MHPRKAKLRRMMALHNAELAGREWAKAGHKKADHPYKGKKLRGTAVGLYRAWERGYDEEAAKPKE